MAYYSNVHFINSPKVLMHCNIKVLCCCFYANLTFLRKFQRWVKEQIYFVRLFLPKTAPWHHCPIQNIPPDELASFPEKPSFVCVHPESSLSAVHPRRRVTVTASVDHASGFLRGRACLHGWPHLPRFGCLLSGGTVFWRQFSRRWGCDNTRWFRGLAEHSALTRIFLFCAVQYSAFRSGGNGSGGGRRKPDVSRQILPPEVQVLNEW